MAALLARMSIAPLQGRLYHGVLRPVSDVTAHGERFSAQVSISPVCRCPGFLDPLLAATTTLTPSLATPDDGFAYAAGAGDDRDRAQRYLLR
jgi:hypothetical protein